MSNLTELITYGQSYWLDNLSRNKINSGELQKRVSEQGLRGITSNPTIFNKAITKGTEYEEQIKFLVKEGKTPAEIYDALTIKDVQDACSILNPVYEQSGGTDGFVSLEVSPYLANDTESTIKEARRLHNAVNKKNCLIKIPGTIEGIPAIEQMLYEGININVTLLFSVERYTEIANAHIRAIQRRLAEGKPIENIISMASIFISRIDVLVDQLLGQHIKRLQAINSIAPTENLSGKSGVAMARLVYRRFTEIFNSAIWKNLSDKGAHLQYPLWASTGNKDALHNDLRYIEPLIGEYTINTMTDETITAFEEHGHLKKNAIEENPEEAYRVFDDLKKLGIDMAFVTQQLENEGIQKFTDSYNELLTNLANKRLKILGIGISEIKAGKLDKELKSAYDYVDEKQVARLLFEKNPYLWNVQPEKINGLKNSLGWLTLPDIDIHDRLIEFSSEIRNEGFTDVVLLGMGGSSLCTEVTRETFEKIAGYPQLWVLDNTEPAAILALEEKIDIHKTLFIVASKSGTTKETICFFKYFYEQLQKKGKQKPGTNFVAITDNGTPLVKMAEEYGFREVFLNSPSVGGRYSVLSDFGLLPMALVGIDIKALLRCAKQMKDSCNAIPTAANPGVSLGIALGICQKHGRDKVTFILSESISAFGYWVEQLLAESTGKDGVGLIPVVDEQLDNLQEYESDRVFVHMYLAEDDVIAMEEKLENLEKAGHPVIRINVIDKIALGGEYYRWEIATAIAGMVMSIDPFDQPNVEESKRNTNQILEEWGKNGGFENTIPVLNSDNISVYAGKTVESFEIDQHGPLGDFISDFTAQAHEHDYVALLPYFSLTNNRTKILQKWRAQLTEELKVATTLLNGPRYLHSTGQLHKGGPNTGLYILLTGNETESLGIPGEKFGFEILHHAQALGDFRSLSDNMRRVLHINLGDDIDSGLNKLYKLIKDASKHRASHEVL